MKIVKYESVHRRRLVGIRCDRCGAKARLDDGMVGVCAMQEYLGIDFTAGYGAQAFDDGTRYSCELCEYCVKQLLGDILRSEDLWSPVREVDFHHAINPIIKSWNE